MEKMLGRLIVKVIRGINLGIRDVHTSDPYVSIKHGRQKLKTHVIKRDINPHWNEDLVFSISNPDLPINLTVYDHDTLSKDDKMGEAEFEMKPFIRALRMELDDLQSGTVITRIAPSRNNCLSEESCIVWAHGKVTQNMCLRLNNVERGEVEIQLQWIENPRWKGV